MIIKKKKNVISKSKGKLARQVFLISWYYRRTLLNYKQYKVNKKVTKKFQKS